MNEKQLIHDLLIQGKTYHEIASMINSNTASLAQRIRRYRKKDPDSWPRVKKYTEPKQVSVGVQVYECQDCVFIFAAEKDTELESEICCPVCWSSESLNYLETSWIKIHEQ